MNFVNPYLAASELRGAMSFFSMPFPANGYRIGFPVVSGSESSFHGEMLTPHEFVNLQGVRDSLAAMRRHAFSIWESYLLKGRSSPVRVQLTGESPNSDYIRDWDLEAVVVPPMNNLSSVGRMVFSSGVTEVFGGRTDNVRSFVDGGRVLLQRGGGADADKTKREVRHDLHVDFMGNFGYDIVKMFERSGADAWEKSIELYVGSGHQAPVMRVNFSGFATLLMNLDGMNVEEFRRGDGIDMVAAAKKFFQLNGLDDYSLGSYEEYGNRYLPLGINRFTIKSNKAFTMEPSIKISAFERESLLDPGSNGWMVSVSMAISEYELASDKQPMLDLVKRVHAAAM